MWLKENEEEVDAFLNMIDFNGIYKLKNLTFTVVYAVYFQGRFTFKGVLQLDKYGMLFCGFA